MTRRPTPGTVPPPRFAAGPVGVVVAVQVTLLTILSGRYGFHRDELYFLAAGKRLAWGYVDQPPLTPLLARVATALFGDGPGGLRVASTLIGAVTVVVVALTARELGGGRGAQALTAAATALSTYVLIVTHMLSTATADLLVWTVMVLLVLRLLRSGDGRWWLAVGAAVGVGLLNKWLVLLLVAAIGGGLLAVGPRQALRSAWLLAGAGVALAVAAPTLVWQARHGWPQLTVAAGISAQDGMENRVLFIPLQLIAFSPLLVPVWLAGLARLWHDPGLRWARALAPAYVLLCAEILLLGGKPYYAMPMLPVLVAAGAEPALRWLRGGRGAARRVLAGSAAAVSVAGSLLIGLPLLPADRPAGIVAALNQEAGEQVGWPRLVDTVADAWRQIPADLRPTAVIFTSNYGQAGALERYGPARGLPAPYSGHMSYADWGPPPDAKTGPVLLVGRFDPAWMRRELGGCRLLARNDNGLGVGNEEQGMPVRLCPRPAAPWSRLWPAARHGY